MVLLGAELKDRGAEESPLHARLDLQAGVGHHQLLEARDVRAVVLLAAERLGERAVHGLVLDQEVQLAEHALAVLVLAELILAPERRVLDHLAGLATYVSPRAHQGVVDAGDIDVQVRIRGVGGGASRLRTDGGVDHVRSSQREVGLQPW